MKQNLLTKVLLLFALIVGCSSVVWAQSTKTETFESASTSTNYQGTVTVTAANSSCGIGWSIYYGTVSTNDKISGSKSAQMRWYGNSDHVGNIPYIKTTTAIDGLTNVSFKARTSSTNCKMDVSYSIDGSTWVVGKTHTFSAAGTAESVSLDIPSGNKYVKFGVNSSSTAPGSSSNYKLIVDDVVFTYTSSLETPTWSLEPTSATVEMNQSTTLQLTTNYDGTLNFESEDEDIATVSFNSLTKKITVTGHNTPGSTTINVTGTATSTYEAITKSFAVKVNHPELASNVKDVMGPLGYSYFGLSAQSTSNDYAQPDVTSTDKTDVYGVTISFAKAGSNNTKPRFDATYTRFYQGNTLTVTAPTGSYIRKIVFVEPSTGKDWSGTMTVDYGNYVSSEKAWFATTEDVTSVKFTNSATKRIGSLEVYLMAPPATISLDARCTDGEMVYGTYSNICPFVVSDDIIVSEISIVEGKLNVEEYATGAIVPANTGVMISAMEGGDYEVQLTKEEGTSVLGEDNCLRATGTGITSTEMAAADENCKFYRLTMHENTTLGFYWGAANGGAFNVAANKAYLAVPQTQAPSMGFDFGEGTTGIQIIERTIKDNQYYTLDGRRVAEPTKGLYIINGKKVVIK